MASPRMKSVKTKEKRKIELPPVGETYTLPYKYEPRWYQRDHIWKPFEEGKKRLIAVWHRRAGKDKTCWNLMIREAFQVPGNYYYVFPTYNEGKKALWDAIDFDGVKFLEHIPKSIVLKRNETDMKVDIRTIDGRESTIQVIGAKEYDRLRGTNPKGIVFSEFSYANPEAWNILRPVLAQNKGWAIFVYTPNGMNHGWDLLAMAQEFPDDWSVSVLTVEDTNVVDNSILEQEHREMPEAFFHQEYYCEFIEGASQVFRRIEENTYHCEEMPAQIGHVYQIGVDLAKYQDWTVMTPFDLTTFKVGPQLRFNQIDWVLQKSRIENYSMKYLGARVNIDSTGVGDPIAEDLYNMGVNIYPYKFTMKSRRQLLDNLAILLEQDKIKIPDDEGLISELRSMRYVIRNSERSDIPRLGLAVPDGMTDDRIMSLALAVWDVREPVTPVTSYPSLYSTKFK